MFLCFPGVTVKKAKEKLYLHIFLPQCINFICRIVSGLNKHLRLKSNKNGSKDIKKKSYYSHIQKKDINVNDNDYKKVLTLGK